MKKRKDQKSKRLFLVILVLVILFSIIFYTVKKDRELNTFESFIKDTVIEIQKIFYKPINSFTTMMEEFTNLKEVKKENQILKSNVEKTEYIGDDIKFEKEMMKNISNDEQTINEILIKLKENEVTPVCMKDIIYDFSKQMLFC